MQRGGQPEVRARIDAAAGSYYRLVLVVGGTDSGKTRALQRLAAEFDAAIINVNLELSRRLLELTERQRRLELPNILAEVVETTEPVVFLDNTEILFDVSLQHDPLRVFQTLSRGRTVVASWNGEVQDTHLVYGAPEHPEYRRYPVGDLVVMRPEEVLS